MSILNEVNRTLTLNKVINNIEDKEIIKEGKKMRIVGSMYGDKGKVVNAPSKFVDEIGATEIVEWDFKKPSGEDSEIIGYTPSTGGGRQISIIDIFTATFGSHDNVNKLKVYKTKAEAIKAAKELVKEWDSFLKSKGIK